MKVSLIDVDSFRLRYKWQLTQLQSLPLVAQIIRSQRLIRQWYEYWDGQVYISFSGGKDSTVLLDLVRKIYPDVPAVFCDTGLEYPEIRDFVKTFDNVVWLKPEMNFKQVIEKYGYPVISKEVARAIYYAQKDSEWAIKKMNGQFGSGEEWNQKKHFKKYAYLINAPFNISDHCCDIMKKKPFKNYEKETSRKGFTGVMADESFLRQSQWIKKGCNSFKDGRVLSNPMATWKEHHIWEYINTRNLPYSKIYNTGVTRTGCMFCMLGVHLEKEPNRFQLMQDTHPKQYDYCINKLGLGKVLDYINVPHTDRNLFNYKEVQQ